MRLKASGLSPGEGIKGLQQGLARNVTDLVDVSGLALLNRLRRKSGGDSGLRSSGSILGALAFRPAWIIVAVARIAFSFALSAQQQLDVIP